MYIHFNYISVCICMCMLNNQQDENSIVVNIMVEFTEILPLSLFTNNFVSKICIPDSL